MKHIKLLLLFILAFLCLACNKDQNTIANATERIDEAIFKAKKTLSNANNGWLLKMYPANELIYGGYNVLIDLNGIDKATIANELFDADDFIISDYAINNTAGPSLVFTTNNRNIHVFSTPGGQYSAIIPDFPNTSSSVGAKGDFIFVFQEINEDKIIVRSLRTNDILLEMVKMKDDVDWSDFLTKVKQQSKLFYKEQFQISIDGNIIEGSNIQNSTTNLMKRVLTLNIEKDKTIKVPFIYTPTGIEFYKPLTLLGTTIKTLDIKQEGENIIYTSQDGKVVYK